MLKAGSRRQSGKRSGDGGSDDPILYRRPASAGETPTWFYAENTEFDATRPAVFCFGTSEKDTYVMMNVFCGDKQLESKALNLSDTIVRFTYPYLESYGDGIFVNFCMVRDGQLYQEQVSVEKQLGGIRR